MTSTKIVIAGMPPRTQAYYDWLLTGLGILEEQGKVEVHFEGHLWDKLLRAHPKVMSLVRRISPDLQDFVSPIDYVCLTGRIEKGGKTATFAMDIADAAFNFSMALLEAADVYFKCQCPIKFEAEGFPLTSRIRIPYHPDIFTFQKKIKPAMLGRPLGHGVNFARNCAELKKWRSVTNSKKDIRLFASFGSDTGPLPRTPKTTLPAPHNYENESSLLCRWGDQVHHANLKRARIVEILRSWNKEGVDARVWRSTNPKISGRILSESEYMQALGRSCININISGFRRSVPYRFMDTFLAGGCVATDTLAVQWYRPFEKGVELFEIGDLGYEKNEDVDWNQLEKTLLNLYEKAPQLQANTTAILDNFEKKWAPEVFASYFLGECLAALEAK